ncbi:MAG: glycosyltransferase [Blastocatellia bacterium]|nr:glycosyltransferase [Blastocatellia bacterium]
MISGLDIICISSIEWDFLWQGHQEITSRLAEAGNRVLYIENTGVRSPGIRDARRIGTRIKNWIRSLRSHGLREVAPNIFVCSPLVLPPFGAGWQRAINRRLLLPLIVRSARTLGMKNILLWSYLPTDTALDLVRMLRGPKTCLVYYCVDNFALLTPKVHALRENERATLRLSDVVFTTCSELAANCTPWNDNVHIFPFGVNLEAFPFECDARIEPRPMNNGSNSSTSTFNNSFFQSLPRPVIGYIGGIHVHIDFGLLIEMARAKPEWSWIFVGALQTPVGELGELPNVHFLGQQPHGSLVRYVREFDVCIVPYVNSHYTATVVPTKINEYLALAKPVVSTDLPAVSEFNREHNILQTSTTRPSDFLSAIEQALSLPTDKATLDRRREVANLADWQARFGAMSEIISQELKAREPEST